jgi:hypothetical protein
LTASFQKLNILGLCYFDHQFWTRDGQDTLLSAMSDIDLEKGPQLSMWDISIPLPPDSPALPEFIFSEEVNVPLPSPPPGEESQLLNYGDRLVSNYLGPRAQVRKHELRHYDHTSNEVSTHEHRPHPA